MASSSRRLELYFLDPEDDYRLVRSLTMAWPMEEGLLHRQGLLCDGERLIVLGPSEMKTQRSPGALTRQS